MGHKQGTLTHIFQSAQFSVGLRARMMYCFVLVWRHFIVVRAYASVYSYSVLPLPQSQSWPFNPDAVVGPRAQNTSRRFLGSCSSFLSPQHRKLRQAQKVGLMCLTTSQTHARLKKTRRPNARLRQENSRSWRLIFSFPRCSSETTNNIVHGAFSLSSKHRSGRSLR